MPRHRPPAHSDQEQRGDAPASSSIVTGFGEGSATCASDAAPRAQPERRRPAIVPAESGRTPHSNSAAATERPGRWPPITTHKIPIAVDRPDRLDHIRCRNSPGSGAPPAPGAPPGEAIPSEKEPTAEQLPAGATTAVPAASGRAERRPAPRRDVRKGQAEAGVTRHLNDTNRIHTGAQLQETHAPRRNLHSFTSGRAQGQQAPPPAAATKQAAQHPR